MTKLGFREKLTLRQKEINSLVCVGLDPLADKMPPSVITTRNATTGTSILIWMRKIVNATAPYASMFKLQHAHWESILGGIKALQALIIHIHKRHPSIPVFLDCKRGDIGRTQERYRVAHFNLEGADGMNYNGYMGRDTLESLIDSAHMERALVGLGRTSNPEAWEIQDRVLKGGMKIWELMVENTHAWSSELGVLDNAGIVMGAAHKHPTNSDKIYSSHLSRARKIVGDDLWFLIPGIGTQGGFVKDTVRSAYVGPGSIAINSSSGIIFASSGTDFAKAAAREAMALRDNINQYR